MKSLITLGVILAIYIHQGNGRRLFISRGESNEIGIRTEEAYVTGNTELVFIDYPGLEKRFKDYPVPSTKGQGWLNHEDEYGAHFPILCGGKGYDDECDTVKCYHYALDNWIEYYNHQPEYNMYSSNYVESDTLGAVIMGGGQTCSKNERNECECRSIPLAQVYDWYTRKWKIYDNAYVPANFHGCTAQIDDQTTWIGSKDQTQSFNWETSETNTLSPLPDSSLSEMMCSYDKVSGRVVIAGGISSENKTTNAVWLYDPLTDTYEKGQDLPFKMIGGVFTYIGNDLVLTGGKIDLEGKNAYSKNLYQFSAKEGWIQMEATMKYGRAYHNAILLKDKDDEDLFKL